MFYEIKHGLQAWVGFRGSRSEGRIKNIRQGTSALTGQSPVRANNEEQLLSPSLFRWMWRIFMLGWVPGFSNVVQKRAAKK